MKFLFSNDCNHIYEKICGRFFLFPPFEKWLFTLRSAPSLFWQRYLSITCQYIKQSRELWGKTVLHIKTKICHHLCLSNHAITHQWNQLSFRHFFRPAVYWDLPKGGPEDDHSWSPSTGGLVVVAILLRMIVMVIMMISVVVIRDRSCYQIGWIFRKIPNGLHPPPEFSENYVSNFSKKSPL